MNKLVKWIWINREKKAMQEMHPDKIASLFASGIDLDELDKYL